MFIHCCFYELLQPVFIFSLDMEPVYIGPDLLTSVALGDVVMAIQNSALTLLPKHLNYKPSTVVVH